MDFKQTLVQAIADKVADAIVVGVVIVLTLIYHALLKQGWYFVVLFAFGVLLIAVGVVFAIKRKTGKKSEEGEIKGITPKTTKVIKAIEGKEPTNTEWLEKVLNDDIAGLRLHYCRKIPDWNGLDDKEPFFKLEIYTLNLAIFSLLIKAAGGKMQAEEGPLGGMKVLAKEIQLVKEQEIKHATFQLITIKQEIATKEKADDIKAIGKAKGHVSINLNDCYLIAHPQIPGRKVEPIKVSLGGNNEWLDYKDS